MKETYGWDEARCCKIQQDSWLWTFLKKLLLHVCGFHQPFPTILRYVCKTLVFSFFFTLANTEFIADLGLAGCLPSTPNLPRIPALFGWGIFFLACLKGCGSLLQRSRDPCGQRLGRNSTGQQCRRLNLEPRENFWFFCQLLFQLSWNCLSVATNREDKGGSPSHMETDPPSQY